jgi:hypothetical protein
MRAPLRIGVRTPAPGGAGALAAVVGRGLARLGLLATLAGGAPAFASGTDLLTLTREALINDPSYAALLLSAIRPTATTFARKTTRSCPASRRRSTPGGRR